MHDQRIPQPRSQAWIGAVPLEEAEMLQLLDRLCHDLKSAPLEQQLLLVRDGLILSLLWQSCFRGFNAGAVRLDNLVLPTGGSAIPYLLPKLGMQAGAKLHILPNCTKNKRGGLFCPARSSAVLPTFRCIGCHLMWARLICHVKTYCARRNTNEWEGHPSFTQ